MADNPSAQMLRLIGGYKTTQAVHVAARLGVPDILGNSTKPVKQIAHEVGADEDRLYRVLRWLASLGVFVEGPPKSFANSALSDTLRKQAAGGAPSLRAFALMQTEMHYNPCSYLLEVVRDPSKTGAQLAFGSSFFEHLYADESRAKTFADAMKSLSIATRSGFEAHIPKDVAVVDGAVVVDVGGGNGHVVSQVLKARPTAKAIVMDLSKVKPEFDAFVKETDDNVAIRMSYCAGDFFVPDDIPKNAALYMLGFILHDWDDDSCVRILRAVRNTMAPTSRLMVLECVVDGMNTPDPAKDIDLIMLSALEGRERTKDEYAELFKTAGLQLTSVVYTGKPVSLIMGAPF